MPAEEGTFENWMARGNYIYGEGTVDPGPMDFRVLTVDAGTGEVLTRVGPPAGTPYRVAAAPDRDGFLALTGDWSEGPA